MVDLERFIKAQENDYEVALSEIKNGKKISHWIWYIFPQIKGLGSSSISEKYAIQSEEEAKKYIENDTLREHLIEISEALLLQENDITYIMGYPDNLKLRSSMTLFSVVAPQYDVFLKVLDKFYAGEKDSNTLEILKKIK